MQKPDLIIKSKTIFDSISDEPFPGLIAVRGNRIVSVQRGFDGLTSICMDGTELIDAGDRLVMAGFHDSHTHLMLAGMYRTYVNLSQARSEEETARMTYDYCLAHPDLCGDPDDPKAGWVYGFNWLHLFWDDKVLPSAQRLDHYFPNRPVFLLNAEAHGAWVNSRALELAGITKDTPDPFGGRIERDPEGAPTGVLHDAAMAPLIHLAYDVSPAQEATYLRRFMSAAARLGITSVVDVQPYFGRQLGSLPVFLDLEQRGELTVRITAAQDLLGNLDQAEANSRIYCTDFLRAHVLKSFVDGVFPAHTALLFEDYADAPGVTGTTLYDLDSIAKAVMEAQRRGLWVKIHAIGDRAVNFTLNCYEEALKAYGPRGCRHAIEHIELASDEDIRRFGSLGVTPSVQPEHLGLIPTWEGEIYPAVLGPDRADQTWSFRSLLEAAGHIAFGSDCPVVDNDPIPAIWRGMCRLHNDGLPEGGWNPSQKLPLHEMLRGYTLGPAQSVGRESELGLLREGALADIIIWDSDPFALEAAGDLEGIRRAKVARTIMNGRQVYAVEGL